MNKLEQISGFIVLIKCKNNHRSFISKECPFCGHKSKRPFRYNSKLKVGKSFCCGVSFKDLSWLRAIITDRDRYEIKMIQDSYLIKDEQKKEWIKRYFEDKMSIKSSGFVKSEPDDPSLPF